MSRSGFTEALPRWVVILVVSRDILIVGGFLVAMLINRPMAVRPHPVSKLNTVAQIVLAGLVLASLGLKFDAGWALPVLMGLVTDLDLAFDRLLCRGMDPSFRYQRGRAVGR